MPKRTPSVFVGIDVAKYSFDVCINPLGECRTFPYDEDGIAELLHWLSSFRVARICLEATGGLQRTLCRALYARKFTLSVVNPRLVRDFAKSRNQLAKTDRLDAQVIALFAEKMDPRNTPEPEKHQEQLHDLNRRRQQVSDMIIQEQNRLSHTHDPGIRRMIQAALELYRDQLKELDRHIQQQVTAHPETDRRAKIMSSVPGIGPITSAVLVAELPELGRINKRQIARLIGTAPTNRDSGQLRGKRTTGGGRSLVRKALYMPMLTAIRYNTILKDFYQRLRQNGKPPLVAIIATMRKLIVILNTMIKNNQSWNPAT